MRHRPNLMLLRLGILGVAGVIFSSTLLDYIHRLPLPILTTSPAFVTYHHVDYSQKQSGRAGEAEKKTGYSLAHVQNLHDVAKSLDSYGISYKALADLGLIRLRDEDIRRVPPELHDALANLTPEVTYEIATTPNDPNYSSQSYLSAMQADAAWDITTGSANVTVAIIDTGVYGGHPDLSGKMTAGYDFINGRALTGSESSDDNGHGTIVAGIIGAGTNNSVGIAGVTWNVRLMPIKAIAASGVGTDTDIAQAVRYAADNGARVINMSFGGSFSQTLKDQVDYAWNKGVVLVAASGNNGSETTLYPAGWDNVLSVGSVNTNLQRSSFSNYGDYLDVVASGETILSTNSAGSYSTASGTSVAAPFVSATAALLFSQNGSLDKSEVVNAIESSARDIDVSGTDKYTGHGYLQIKSALQASNLYHYAFVSQSAYPELAAGQSTNLVLTVKNSGSSTWTRGVVNLATDRARDRIPIFLRESGTTTPSGWLTGNRITMQETSVAPGSTATYSFWYTVPAGTTPASYREYFRVVADGITWLPEDYGIYWDVHVQTPLEQYKQQFVAQNAYPTALNRGDAYQFQVVVKNSGTTIWTRGVVNLATNRAQDRVSVFAREGTTGAVSGWSSPNRISMVETSVAPGADATFTFWMKNTNVGAGTYREYFRLVADGIGWLDDLGIYWDVLVQPEISLYTYSYVGQDSHALTLARNDTHQFTLSVRNTGSRTWTRGVVNLATDRAQDRIPVFTREGGSPSGWTSSNRVTMQEASVAPGETATFVFWMRNDGAASGTYNEYFRLVADGIGWMEDKGIFWGITVP